MAAMYNVLCFSQSLHNKGLSQEGEAGTTYRKQSYRLYPSLPNIDRWGTPALPAISSDLLWRCWQKVKCSSSCRCDSVSSGMRFVCRWAPLERSATRPQLIIRSAVWETLRYEHTQHWKIRLTEEFTFHGRRHLNAWPQGNDRGLCVTGNNLKQKIQKCLKGSAYSHRWLSICYFLIFVFYLLQSETASGDIRLKAQILILEEQRREVSVFIFFSYETEIHPQIDVPFSP